MRGWAVFFLAFLVFAASASGAKSERRVALIIGNSTYINNPLPNTSSDAAAMEVALSKLNFDVDLMIDGSAPAIANRVSIFLEKFKNADVGLFYYAGHGIQFKDQNLIVGVDAVIKTPLSLRYETFPLNEVIRNMDSMGKTSLIFWDACRNNPLAEKLKKFALSDVGTGAAAIDGAAGNTLIVFATKPNQVSYDGAGSHSPFAESLLKHIATPGLEVSQILNRVTDEVLQATASNRPPQRPERQASMTKDFYFALAAETTAAPVDEKANRILELEAKIRALEQDSGRAVALSGGELTGPKLPPAVVINSEPAADQPAQASSGQGNAPSAPTTQTQVALAPATAEATRSIIKPTLKDATTFRSIAVSPDGESMATVGDDGLPRIWSLTTLKLLKVLKPGHADKGYAIAFSNDGNLIASGGWDGVVKIWNASTGELVNQIENRADKIYSLAFFDEKNFKYLLGGRRSGNATTWKIKRDRDVSIASNPGGHSGPVHAISFEPAGQGTYVSGGGNGSIIWRSSRGSTKTFTAHAGAVFDVEYSATGKFFVSAGYDRKIKIWDAQTLNLLRTLEGHTRYVLAVAISKDGKFIASAGGDKAIRLWNVETGQVVRLLQGHKQDVEDVYFSPNGDRIVSISEDKTMKVWDVATGQELALVAAFPDGDYLALGSNGNFTGSDTANQHLRLLDKGFEDDLSDAYRKSHYEPDGLQFTPQR